MGGLAAPEVPGIVKNAKRSNSRTKRVSLLEQPSVSLT